MNRLPQMLPEQMPAAGRRRSRRQPPPQGTTAAVQLTRLHSLAAPMVRSRRLPGQGSPETPMGGQDRPEARTADPDRLPLPDRHPPAILRPTANQGRQQATGRRRLRTPGTGRPASQADRFRTADQGSQAAGLPSKVQQADPLPMADRHLLAVAPGRDSGSMYPCSHPATERRQAARPTDRQHHRQGRQHPSRGSLLPLHRSSRHHGLTMQRRAGRSQFLLKSPHRPAVDIPSR